MRLRAGALVLAAAALMAGCDLVAVQEIDSEDVVVAEAFLRTDQGFQEVFLFRTLPGQEGSLRVDDASVEVVRESDGARLPFAEPIGGGACADQTLFSDTLGGTCYQSPSVDGFVQPGETYALRIITVDGRRLEGRTTVPGAFGLRRPAADTCILDSGTVEMTWTASQGAWSYQALASMSGLASGLLEQGVEDPPDELELLGLAIGQADTTLVFPSEFGVFDRFSLDRDVALALQRGLPRGAAADIVVAAGDRNYVNWVRGGNFNPSGQVRVPSVVGDGTGVFAALVAVRQTILSDTSGYPTCQ